jgi:hypothetical protein
VTENFLYYTILLEIFLKRASLFRFESDNVHNRNEAKLDSDLRILKKVFYVFRAQGLISLLHQS